MTGKQFIESNIQCDLERSFSCHGGPYPAFIFRDPRGLIVGEYAPWLEKKRWAGENEETILEREIVSWYISWDMQDIDVVQFWITVGDSN